MASFQFRALDHVNVTAPEELIDDVLEWYESCLGLERMDKPEGTREVGGWFRVGEQELHVSVDPHNPLHDAHFGLVVDDYGQVIEALRGGRCHIEQASPIPGRHRFFTRDPAGNRIEIMSYDDPDEDRAEA